MIKDKSKQKKLIKFFKALINEERLEITRLLIKEKEMCPQDVERNFYLEQSTTSHHLNMLKSAGVAESRREGRNLYYSVNVANLKQKIAEFQGMFETEE